MDELTKLILDKVALGIVVAVVGYFFAIQLEKRKKKLSLLEELSKKRAESIIITYSAIYKYEAKVQRFMALCRQGGEKLDAKSEAETLDQAVADIVREIESNRFLLGEELYREGLKLTDLIRNKMHLVMLDKEDEVKKNNREIETSRRKVQMTLPELYRI